MSSEYRMPGRYLDYIKQHDLWVIGVTMDGQVVHTFCSDNGLQAARHAAQAWIRQQKKGGR